MEKVTVWYYQDNNENERLIDAIRSIGLGVSVLNGDEIKNANINDHQINIVIVDIIKRAGRDILESLSADSRLQSCLKFVFLAKDITPHLTFQSISCISNSFRGR